MRTWDVTLTTAIWPPLTFERPDDRLVIPAWFVNYVQVEIWHQQEINGTRGRLHES